MSDHNEFFSTGCRRRCPTGSHCDFHSGGKFRSAANDLGTLERQGRLYVAPVAVTTLHSDINVTAPEIRSLNHGRHSQVRLRLEPAKTGQPGQPVAGRGSRNKARRSGPSDPATGEMSGDTICSDIHRPRLTKTRFTKDCHGRPVNCSHPSI